MYVFSGGVITASHNPKEYNGFKVYGSDGAQLSLAASDEIIKEVNEVENELTVTVADEEKMKEEGLLAIIGETVNKAYQISTKEVVNQCTTKS